MRSTASSGGRIDYPPVLVSRVGDSADDVLAGLEPAGGDHDDIERIAQITKGLIDLHAFLAPVPGSDSTISRSMSLSWVIPPVAAEPNRMIRSGCATLSTRRTISWIRFSSIPICAPGLALKIIHPRPAGKQAVAREATEAAAAGRAVQCGLPLFDGHRRVSIVTCTIPSLDDRSLQ